MATDPEIDELMSDSVALVERANAKRQLLLRQIEESQKSIERSRELIVRIDEVLAQAGWHEIAVS